MIATILAAMALSPTVEAERAYAALAQTKGQWTAFRETAAPDAVMFVPQPVEAGTWLKDRPDPPVSVMWWPSRVWISCDGRLGINFGPWVRRGGKLVGTFTTIWSKQPDGGWKWQLDRGNVTPAAISAGDAPKEVSASCRNLAAARRAVTSEEPDADALILIGDTMPRAHLPQGTTRSGAVFRSGASPDGTLKWEVLLPSGARSAAHILRAWRWDGRAYRLIVFESSRD